MTLNLNCFRRAAAFRLQCCRSIVLTLLLLSPLAQAQVLLPRPVPPESPELADAQPVLPAEVQPPAAVTDDADVVVDQAAPSEPDNAVPPTAVPEPPPAPEAPSSEPLPLTPNLWIVSTHSSPQSFKESCPQFRPGVTRYQPCCGYQQSSFQELTQSLPPGAPICIMVHGSFVGWEDVCQEALGTYHWLTRDCPGSPLQLICLTWPSDRPMTPLIALDVCVLGRRAERNGFYLADLIQFLPPESPICLMGHSHGNRVVASALHLMGGGEIQGHRHRCARCAGRRIRVVMAAAAIDHDWFNPGQRYECGLRCTECLLNLKNGHDAALKVYPLRRPFSSRALGSSGFTRSDRRKLGRYNGKLKELDVSGAIGHQHYWPEYFGRPMIAARIRNFVHSTDRQLYAQR